MPPRPTPIIYSAGSGEHRLNSRISAHRRPAQTVNGMTIAIGNVIEGYRIDSLIGHGSMAVVYRAAKEDTGEAAAVKVIHPHLIGQPGFLERFQREATVLTDLDHPNIVRVYSSICTPDMAYIIMEYLGGGSLDVRLAGFRENNAEIPLSAIADWLEAIGGAVDCAHEHGLAHRDLKPANIMFRDTGEPVLTDFGLAYLMDHPRLSESNSITGTPAYLSPEQALGSHGDAFSDLYSLGVILYEMITGYTPFQGNVISVVLKHVSEPPPSPREYGRRLPSAAEGVLMRSLAKKPEDRYPSARELARAFRASLGGKSRDGANAEAKAGAARSRLASAPSEAKRSGTGLSGGYSAGYSGVGYSSLSKRLGQTPSVITAKKRKGMSARTWFGMAGVMAAIIAIVIAIVLIAPDANADTIGATPKFSTHTQVRVVVPGGASTSVLRGCPSTVWLGVVGLAANGDMGTVTERRVCGSEWWYLVSFPQSATDEWDGTGWLAEKNLRSR